MNILQFQRTFSATGVIRNNIRRQKYAHLNFSRTILKHSSRQTLISGVSRQFSISTWPSFLSTCGPVLFLQDTLIQIHSATGLPWWSVIMLSTFSLRTVTTLPLAIHQCQVMAKLENLNNDLSELSVELGKEVAIACRTNNWDLKTTERVFKTNMHEYQKKFIVRDNCHPAKLLILVLVQVPMWICFSASLRNICFMLPYPDYASLMTFSQLKIEGALWFADLTVSDSFLLPIMLGIINFTLIEMTALKSITPPSFFRKVFHNIIRGFTFFIVILSSFAPSCISLYWLCSSSFGLCQNILFLLPKVRRALKIPLTPTERPSPFTDIWNNLKSKMK